MEQLGKEIWVKELHGGDWAICILNEGDALLPMQVNWEHFSFLDGEYEVYDI